MNIYLMIYLALTLIGLGLAIGKHGEPKEPWNAWSSLIATVIEITLIMGAVGWTLA